ncbi:MAG TPA: ABC transporter permease [Anaerolineaceae bacterium]|nr:ABC transporter permease [Anaerolineaceae bacterium]
MSKFWLIFRYEYLRHVRRKRFVFALLSMPLFMVFLVGIGFMSAYLQHDPGPIGYVDFSGLLATPIYPKQEEGLLKPVEIQGFDSEQSARAALDAGLIKGYYILPEDYLKTGAVRLVAKEALAENLAGSMADLLQINLLASNGYSAEVRERILQGPEMTVRAPDSGRELSEGSSMMSFILPFMVGILFMISVNTGGGYLVQALAEEKENRTMEIVVTSVSPMQLMSGKILGNLAVGLTQLAVWGVFVVLSVVVAQALIPDLSIELDPTFVLITILTLIPGFIMVGALMALVGVAAVEVNEAQQVAGMFSLPLAVPFWFIWNIMTNPNGPLAVGLSLFPLTAPITLPMRAAYTNVPFWQLALSIGILLACAFGAMWITSRAFRRGMLRYGKRLSLREIFSRS